MYITLVTRFTPSGAEVVHSDRGTGAPGVDSCDDEEVVLRGLQVSEGEGGQGGVLHRC